MPDKDTPTVDFSFDQWERETAVEPFAIVIKGKRYTSVDPFDMDVRKLNELMTGDGTVEEQIKELFPKDHEKILEQHLKAGAMQEFSKKIIKHYGLDPTDA